MERRRSRHPKKQVKKEKSPTSDERPFNPLTHVCYNGILIEKNPSMCPGTHRRY